MTERQSICALGRNIRWGNGLNSVNAKSRAGTRKLGRNKKAAERKDLKNLMQKVENQVNQLIAEDSFSLRRIQELHQGKADNDCTIYSVWDSIIDNKREKESAGTARCNKDVRRRFERHMGSNVQFA